MDLRPGVDACLEQPKVSASSNLLHKTVVVDMREEESKTMMPGFITSFTISCVLIAAPFLSECLSRLPLHIPMHPHTEEAKSLLLVRILLCGLDLTHEAHPFNRFSVPHDRLFFNALERDLKREKEGSDPTTRIIGEPALSFTYDSKKSLYEQFGKAQVARMEKEITRLKRNNKKAFNPSARFASDYSGNILGAQFNAATMDEANAINNEIAQVWVQDWQQMNGLDGVGCVPPALLFGGGEEMRGGREPIEKPHAQTAPLTPIALPQPSGSDPAQPAQGTSNTHLQSASPPRPPTSLMSKPFRCPKPNCNKSYKQENGLKYHMAHGSCNFPPPKDLEHVKDLLERKRRERREQAAQGAGLTRSPPTPSGSSSAHTPTPLSQNLAEDPNTPGTLLSPTSILSLTYSDLSNMSESDLREIEREAERRLRPFPCGIGECTRRYKNMNGLRYHYQHSGDHGSVGLALLASGQYECLGAGKRGLS